MEKVSRREQLRRAAEMRSAISSLIFNSPSSLSASQIGNALSEKMKELGYNETNLSNFLFTMSKNNLISRTGGLGHVVYGKANSEVEIEPSEKRKKVKHANPAAEIAIDIVKSTGKVRLQIKGLVIEIGVVD